LKPKKAMIAASLAIALVLLISGQTVTAQSHPQQYYGSSGGEIRGLVLGANKVLDWAIVHAKSSEHSYEAFSGMTGAYQMRVPVGTYNVSASFPGYQSTSTNVTVTEGSSVSLDFHLSNSITVAVSSGSYSVINFYLDENQVPVPEFKPPITLAVFAITMLTMTLILRRSRAAHNS
jgi:hypothetical protein